MDIIKKEQFEEYKKILYLYDNLSVDCIIEHYKIALINWLLSKFINECNLNLMVKTFKFLCRFEKNEKLGKIKLTKNVQNNYKSIKLNF